MNLCFTRLRGHYGLDITYVPKKKRVRNAEKELNVSQESATSAKQPKKVIKKKELMNSATKKPVFKV